MAALERLEQAGVEDEDVTLVSVVISKDALEILTEEAEDMRVVRRMAAGGPCHREGGGGGYRVPRSKDQADMIPVASCRARRVGERGEAGSGLARHRKRQNLVHSGRRGDMVRGRRCLSCEPRAQFAHFSMKHQVKASTLSWCLDPLLTTFVLLCFVCCVVLRQVCAAMDGETRGSDHQVTFISLISFVTCLAVRNPMASEKVFL